MNEKMQILINTPLYVWVILVYLLYVGILSTKTRFVYLPNLFVVPLLLCVLQYQLFLAGGAAAYASIILAAAVIFFIHSRQNTKIIKHSLLVEVKGNYLILPALLAFFMAKYYFGYYAHQEIESFNVIFEGAMTGLFSGYFAGRAFGYLYKFYKTY